MAKYTMELREIFEPIRYSPPLFSREEVESWFKSYNIYDYLRKNEIIIVEKAGLWDKDKLARKIVDHYYLREIGFETIPLFKHYVKVTMNEIMERYLPLIYSASIEYDPLVNVDYSETFTRNKTNESSYNTEGSSNSESTSNTSGLNVGSDTPQGQINKQTILSGTYATSTEASEGTSNITDETTSTGEGTSTGEENEDYTKRIRGNSGISATAQKMIQQYRDNIIAIDAKIIEELNILFMGLY